MGRYGDDEIYDDDEYYEDDDDEQVADADSLRSAVNPFSSSPGQGLPGSGRFSGGSSRFGASGTPNDNPDDDPDSGRRYGSGTGSSPFSSSSRFGGSSSRFGSGSSSSSGSRFGSGSSDDDKKDDSGSSRFGGSSSRFGGGSSSSSGSRFGSGSSSNDDKKDDSGSSRFGGSSSRFGSGSSSSSGSRFGSGSSSDDDKKDDSGSSRFGGSSSRFGSGSSSSSGSRFGSGSGSSPSSGSRFGSGSSDDDKKSDSRSSSSSSSNADKKTDDKSSFGSRFGGFFNRGKKDDSQPDDKNKKDDSSSSRYGGGSSPSSGSRYGTSSSGNDKKSDSSFSSSSSSDTDKKADDKSSSGSRLGRFLNRGKKDDSQPDDKGKQADKKSEDKASSGGRFGGLAARIPGFGRKKDADASASTSSADDKKQSAFGADSSKGKTSRIGGKSSKTNTDKKDATAKTETPSLFTRISERLPFGHRLKESRSKKATSKTRAERAKKTPHLKEGEGLSLDDKLDILGVALVVTALVLFFSSLSNQQGTLTGTINTLISQIFGNGAIAVPFAMGAIGVWLIIRHFGDEAPEIDPVRIAGLVMLYIGILMVFMIIETFIDSIYTLANAETFPIIVRNHTIQNGWGGGWIGGELYILLVTMLGEIPAFFAVFGWIIVSVMLATRTTAAELAVFVISAWRSFQIAVQRRAQARRVERMKQLEARNQQQAAEVHISKPEPGSLPAGSQSALPQGEVPIEQRGILIRRGGEAQPIQNAPAASAPPPPTQLPEREAQSRGGLLSSFTSRLKNAVPFSGSKSNEQAITAQPEPELEIVKPQEKIISSPPPPTTMPTPAKEQSTTAVPANPAQPAAASVGGRSPFARPDGAESSLLKPRPFTSPAFTPKSDEDDDQETTTAPDDLLARDFPQSAERAARLDQLRSGLTRPTIDDEDDEEDDDLMDDEALAAAVQPAAFSPFNKPERDAAGTPSHSQGFTLPTSKAGTPPKPQDDSSAVPKPVEPQNRPMPKVVASAEPAPAINPGQKRTEQPAKVSATPMRGANKQWRLPDYRTLLAPGSEGDFDRNQLVQRARIIEETLKSFGAPGKVVEINTGPVITQFGVEPDYLEGRSGKKSRVKVSAIAQLDKDLQLALGAKSIRVEAPVPGKGFVGIEVPNEEASLVSLRDVMESPQFNKIAEKSMLAICLGQSVDGTPVAADLAQMPHLLVAGTTGSGKSVCVNAIIASLLIRNTPDQVKFIMVDPKRVELTGYNGIPHLVAPVVVELERIVGVLKWVTREMDERYKKFSEAGARNITDYNEHRPETTPPMPYIVVIIDELADLMMLAPDETERVITRIAALARATGIHLVIATQRPSVDVVTGLIKANFPARIAFAVAGGVDSRVILDQPGAERLLGKGDMLYMSGDSPAPQRLQGVFVSDMEINNICRYWRSQGVATEQKPITALVMDDSTESTASIIPKGDRFMASPPPSTQKAFWDETSPANPDNHSAGYGSTSVDEAGHEDELYAEAVELVRRLNKASVSLLQRRLRIGYTRAARLIDVMEAEGVVGPPTEGSKPREVLPYKK